MKKVRQILAISFIFAFIMSISSINAFAATVTQDDLEVTLVTDKEQYAENEKIKTTLTVKNNNGTAVTNVDLETALPNGYKLADKSENKKTVDSIAAGVSVLLDVTLEKDNIKKVSTPMEPTSDPKSSTNTVSGGSGTTSGGTTTNGTAVQTGQTYLIIGAVLIVLMTVGLLFVFVYRRKKLGKKILSMILCIGVVGSSAFLIKFTAKADETEVKSITISEAVKVGKNELTIVSIVRYSNDSGEKGLDKPDNPTGVDDYYWDVSEKVIAVIDADKSADLMSESQAYALLHERGFIDLPITYTHSSNGQYVGKTEVSQNSQNKHPLYQTNYLSSDNNVWTIYIINGNVYANPASFNLDSDLEAELLVSESDSLTSYNDAENKFFVTIPKRSYAIVKMVSKINAENIEKLTSEELSK